MHLKKIKKGRANKINFKKRRGDMYENGKTRHVESIPGMERGDKGE
jgi:hypothetical protein